MDSYRERLKGEITACLDALAETGDAWNAIITVGRAVLPARARGIAADSGQRGGWVPGRA